jgi:hypothetical protein
VYLKSYLLRRQKLGLWFKAKLVKQLERPYLEKKPHHKKGWWSGSRCNFLCREQKMFLSSFPHFSQLYPVILKNNPCQDLERKKKKD